MKDHELRELVNRLTKLAQEYAHTQQLRERIAGEVLPAINAAVIAERERCVRLCHLKIADAHTRALYSEGWTQAEVMAFTTAAESIADAISGPAAI